MIHALERGGTSLLPTPETVLQAGDHVSILMPGETPGVALELVHLCTGM